MQNLSALALVDSASPAFRNGIELVFPYLEHFGVPFQRLDAARTALPEDLNRFPLIILAHDHLGHLSRTDLIRLRDAVRAGSGLVSFDPAVSGWITTGKEWTGQTVPAEEVCISTSEHLVTALHTPGQVFHLLQPVSLTELPGLSLAGYNSSGLLSAETIEKGRVVHWGNTAWMHPSVFGPMAGLDDLVWRSLVWAARKPFCIRGLPPLVTMRVDDVAGRGGLWDASPLYWVEDSIQAGFKPWLGLFIYNLTPEGVNQLRGQIQAGQATAFPHAFGRPSRTPDMDFPYYEDALPLRAETYDEFIFFDHQRGQPWSNDQALRGLEAVDRWFAAQDHLPMSRVALPHWYEMGANTCTYVKEKWGCEFMGKIMDADLPLAPGIPWIKSGPFRRYETPGEAFPHNPNSLGRRPVYYADFIEVGGQRFFNSLTEIRDDAGYEWRPDNDVEATAARAVRQIRRALDSMALGQLFTHETDHIYKIRPENWHTIMKIIQQDLASLNPIQVTLDEGMRYLRSVKTSHLTGCFYDPQAREVRVELQGESEVPTHFYLYEQEDIEGRLLEVPAFQGQCAAHKKAFV